MTARSIALSQIICDGCQLVFSHMATPVVRESAAADGWEHRTVKYQRSNWLKQVDLCPQCKGEST